VRPNLERRQNVFGESPERRFPIPFALWRTIAQDVTQSNVVQILPKSDINMKSPLWIPAFCAAYVAYK
jgi:hypothetical protein